jgi:hypothetical protein
MVNSIIIKKLRISYKISRLKYFPKKANEKNELCLFYKVLLKNKIKQDLHKYDKKKSL